MIGPWLSARRGPPPPIFQKAPETSCQEGVKADRAGRRSAGLNRLWPREL